MITITTNFDEVIAGVTAKLNMLDGQRICMAMAMGVIDRMHKRIHQDGIDADGNPIGTYSECYMKVRTGNYGDAGLQRRGKNKGKPRPLYNRDADSKVIASLTRQMENAMTVIPLVNGAGIGYHDELSYNKSKWVENTYGKDIFALTDDERALAVEIAKDETNKILGQ